MKKELKTIALISFHLFIGPIFIDYDYLCSDSTCEKQQERRWSSFFPREILVEQRERSPSHRVDHDGQVVVAEVSVIVVIDLNSVFLP